MSLGSVDIQKDHLKEQRKEKENVRGFHRDSSTAHVTGGLNTFAFIPAASTNMLSDNWIWLFCDEWFEFLSACAVLLLIL